MTRICVVSVVKRLIHVYILHMDMVFVPLVPNLTREIQRVTSLRMYCTKPCHRMVTPAKLPSWTGHCFRTPIGSTSSLRPPTAPGTKHLHFYPPTATSPPLTPCHPCHPPVHPSEKALPPLFHPFLSSMPCRQSAAVRTSPASWPLRRWSPWASR